MPSFLIRNSSHITRYYRDRSVEEPPAMTCLLPYGVFLRILKVDTGWHRTSATAVYLTLISWHFHRMHCWRNRMASDCNGTVLYVIKCQQRISKSVYISSLFQFLSNVAMLRFATLSIALLTVSLALAAPTSLEEVHLGKRCVATINSPRWIHTKWK